MVLANTSLQNVESPVQILEALGEVATVMVVDGESGVA